MDVIVLLSLVTLLGDMSFGQKWGMWPQPWDSWLYVKAWDTCLLGGRKKTGLRQT